MVTKFKAKWDKGQSLPSTIRVSRGQGDVRMKLPRNLALKLRNLGATTSSNLIASFDGNELVDIDLA